MAQDHFERHNHYDGAVDWNFNVVYNNQPSVVAMAQAYAPILKRPELYDPIPTEWLHATILRVGTVDEYTESEMLAVAEKVQPAAANSQTFRWLLLLPVKQYSICIIFDPYILYH